MLHRLQSVREFLTLGSLATVAAVVGIGSGIYSMTQSGGGGGGGGGSGAPGATGYVPRWQGGADQLWQQIMQQWGQQAGGDASVLGPYLQQALQGGMTRAAGYGRRMDTMGDTMEGVGNRFLGGQADLYGAGRQVFDTALDPQNALHDRMEHDVTEGSRSATSLRGIGMSPEAANLESQATSNFNIDWQNQQLQRQLSGLQGMSGAYDAGGRQGQAGEAAYVGASNMWNQATALPFNLASMYGGAMGSSVYNPWNALSGNLGQYMGLGQSGGQNAFGQQQTNLNNLTSGLTTLGQQPWLQNYFNPGSTGSGGSSTVDDTTWGGA